MSFIKMLNNKGLRRLPNGAPQRKDDHSEDVLSYVTFVCVYTNVNLKVEGLVLVTNTLLTLQVVDCGRRNRKPWTDR